MASEPVVIGDATLYLGDCLALLPTLAAGSVDAVLTDPPFVVKDAVEHRGNPVAVQRQTSTTIGNQGWTYGKEWLREAARVCERHIVAFGAYADLPDLLADHGQGELRGVFVWKKSNAPLAAWNVPHYDIEFAAWFGRGRNPANIKSLDSMVIDHPKLATGCFASERLLDPTGKAAHPAQQPAYVMRRLLLAFTEPGDVVLDPFMGTGTTGAVAVSAGRKFIGIEINPAYFDLACRRVREAQGMTGLFAPPRQASLFDGK